MFWPKSALWGGLWTCPPYARYHSIKKQMCKLSAVPFESFYQHYHTNTNYMYNVCCNFGLLIRWTWHLFIPWCLQSVIWGQICRESCLLLNRMMNEIMSDLPHPNIAINVSKTRLLGFISFVYVSNDWYEGRNHEVKLDEFVVWFSALFFYGQGTE